MISYPESGLQNAPGFRHRNTENSGHVVSQWCHSCVPSFTPEKTIPCPNLGGTSVWQFHGVWFLPPAPQVVGAARLLEFMTFNCYQQRSARQSTRPLTVTTFHRQKRVPDSGFDFKTAFANVLLPGCGAAMVLWRWVWQGFWSERCPKSSH